MSPRRKKVLWWLAGCLFALAFCTVLDSLWHKDGPQPGCVIGLSVFYIGSFAIKARFSK